MARKERVRVAAAGRLEGLLAAGDHGGARAEAARVAADPASTEAERVRATEAVRSLAPDPGALALGAASAAVALAILAWLLAR